MKIKDFEKYIVTKDLNDSSRHADRCDYSWKNLYKPVYSSMEFWKNTDFSKVSNSGYIFYNNTECSISGDVFFNFKKGIKTKKYQKYEYFEELLRRDFSGDRLIESLKKLDYCNQMFHSFHNFVLLPVPAGLNNFKGTSSFIEENFHFLDRPDKLLYLMNQYFKERNEDNCIFSSAAGRKSKKYSAEENTIILKKTLKDFLDTFDTFDDFCKNLFLIEDKEFIKKLVENGKKDILTGEDVENYMDLAIEFWNLRHKIISEKVFV